MGASRRNDPHPVAAEDIMTVLGPLEERRNNLVTQRTRLVNQLHALLRDLLPGSGRQRRPIPAPAQEQAKQ
jgi:transposase